MSSLKRWKQLSGGNFFKFNTPGQTLEGTWQGTQAGKFGENGVVKSGDDLQIFTLNTTLRDLVRVPKGTEVRITYTGKQTSKAGNEFKAFVVEVEEGVTVEEQADDDVPF